MKKLNVGVLGTGRMGRIYANNLANRVPRARLLGVAARHPEHAQAVAAEFGLPRWYENHQAMLADPEIEAVVVLTSSSTHREMVTDAVRAGKAVFCEKPIATSLEDAEGIQKVVESSGAFLQIAFQRRFDAAYAAAKQQVDAGVIGDPVLFVSTSRDPERPPLEFCDPKVSGGMINDMGGHDFDICRVFMGDVASVFTTAGTLAYPELKPIGDIDNAIINLTFTSGKLGIVMLSRHSVFGYDIRGEIWGTKGSLQIGYFRQTPVLVMTKGGISHDVVPGFTERFEGAYLAQIQNFVDNVLDGRKPSVTAADAIAALRISLAANESYRQQRPIAIGSGNVAAA